MARDGVCPFVALEDAVVEYERRGRLVALLGLDYNFDLEYGMSHQTVIIMGPVPAKYISISSGDIR